MGIGGTSGNPASSANMLSLNVNGVDVNYDLGPSLSAVASQSEAFLNNSFNADTAFVGGAITGSTKFLQGITAPVLDMAATQQNFNVNQLPAMFSILNAQNFALGNAAIAANKDVAESSIASSNASAQAAGSGGCFITSAVCATLGLPDDCHALTTLRAFRDGYLARLNVGRAYVAEYYVRAPALAARIRARADARAYLAGLFDSFILPAVIAIEGGEHSRAFKIYRQLFYKVARDNL